MVKPNTQSSFALPKSFWIICVTTVLIIAISVWWFFYWLSGWPHYKDALNKCNGNPPVQAGIFMTTTYSLPGDKSYNIPGDQTAVYYCTEAEAIKNGFYRSDT